MNYPGFKIPTNFMTLNVLGPAYAGPIRTAHIVVCDSSIKGRSATQNHCTKLYSASRACISSYAQSILMPQVALRYGPPERKPACQSETVQLSYAL